MAAAVVRKTVALHPSVDAFVKEAWAALIDRGFEATYSMALNFMLVGHHAQASLPEGLDREARDMMWDFAADPITTRHLNIQDHLARLAALMREAEPIPFDRSPGERLTWRHQDDSGSGQVPTP